MNKLKIIAIITVLIGGGMLSDIGYAADYGCTEEYDESGEGFRCDGYWVHSSVAPRCSSASNCALDGNDTNAVCYNGYCMRKYVSISSWSTTSYFGGNHTSIGMLDTMYPCPSHGTCERGGFIRCDNNYYPQPVTANNQPIAPGSSTPAINIQCLPCPQYNNSNVVLKSLDFDDSKSTGWGITLCYLVSGQDTAGKYQYTGDGCQYSE